MTRNTIREAAAIVERHWDDWALETGHNHPAFVLRAGERKRRCAFPASPSDTNWYKAFERDVRAAVADLRETGQ
jgi:metallophosphoesterase superfamily enzyme